MSASGRAAEFMRAWGEGHNKPHNPDHRQWGADECDACMAEAYDPYEALVHAAGLMGWGLTYGVVRKLCQDWEDAAAPMRISVAAASVRACARDLRALLARCNLDGDPAGSDTGVADSDRGSSSGTNLRPGGEPSPSRQGRAGSRFFDLTAREYRMDQLTADLADMVLEGEPRPVVDDWVEIVQPVIGPLSQRPAHHRDRLRAQVFGVASDGTLRLGFPPPGQLVHVFIRDETPSQQGRVDGSP